MKTVLVLLLVGLCFGGATVQAKDRPNKSFVELQQAAEQGDAYSQFQLALKYDDGIGTPQDHRQAFAWYRKAAEQGFVAAQNNLAVKYLIGEGVPQNYKLAYVWFSVVAANGLSMAIEGRDKAAKQLPPAVLADAQTLASEYFEKYQTKTP